MTALYTEQFCRLCSRLGNKNRKQKNIQKKLLAEKITSKRAWLEAFSFSSVTCVRMMNVLGGCRVLGS